MTSKAIIFENPGEIDPRLISLMGVNVKENDSPIGFFGTGLKYALATALRNKCQVTIQSGTKRYCFWLRSETIRGKAFDTIQMQSDGGEFIDLGFTTELGKTWGLWMAYREFLCNALDEKATFGQAGFEGDPSIEPKEGLTRLIVQGESFVSEHRKRSEWYLTSKPIERIKAKNFEISLHPGPGKGIFYQGILVRPFGQHSNYSSSLFTYNIHSTLELSEDRQSKHWYQIGEAIANTLSQACSNRVILKEILLAKEGVYENKIDWSWAASYNVGQDFIETIDSLFDKHFAAINPSAINLVRDKLKTREPKSIQLSRVQQVMLERAKRACSSLGQPIGEEIIFVESLGSQWIHGLAKEGRIFIPLTTFDKGTKYLASTLLEEHLHCSLKLNDCSRELQDWLFNKVLSQAEEISGEPL